MSLPEPACEGGYTADQVEEIMGAALPVFNRWMRGQTIMLCEGWSYNHETKHYDEACGGVAHGPVVYPWDLKRFLDGVACTGRVPVVLD